MKNIKSKDRSVQEQADEQQPTWQDPGSIARDRARQEQEDDDSGDEQQSQPHQPVRSAAPAQREPSPYA